METAANQLRTPDQPVESAVSEDGNFSEPAPAPAPAPQQQQGEAENRPEPQPWKDEKRGEIFSRARQKRLEETETFSGDPNDPAAQYGTDIDQHELGDLEREALRRRQENFSQGQQP
jgi:hypothetical protein